MVNLRLPTCYGLAVSGSQCLWFDIVLLPSGAIEVLFVPVLVLLSCFNQGMAKSAPGCCCMCANLHSFVVCLACFDVKGILPGQCPGIVPCLNGAK